MTDRQHDPETADDAGRYRDHLDAFGAALHDAARDHRALRPAIARRPVAVVAALVVAAATAVALLSASPGSRSVDVLGRAQAALTSRGELIHYVVRVADGPSIGSGIDLRVARDRCPKSGPVEVWQATNPVRWRVVLPAMERALRCRGTRDSALDRRLGEQHYSYADGVLTQYSPEEDRLTVTRGYTDAPAPPTGGLWQTGTRGEEPLVVLRRMLSAGLLVEAGQRTVNGRPARTLTRTTEHRSTVDGTVSTRDEVTIYDVDAGTFAPVRIVRGGGIPIVRRARGREGTGLRIVGRRPTASQFDFERYERIPLDDAGRRLLTIAPSRPPKVVEQRTRDGRDAVDRAGP